MRVSILPRRQECPPEAFISVDELQKLHEASTAKPRFAETKRAPIIAVSHFWREKGHPDKNGVTLRFLGKTLEKFMFVYENYRLTEMGVFFDWCSLYQEPPSHELLARTHTVNIEANPVKMSGRRLSLLPFVARVSHSSLASPCEAM